MPSVSLRETGHINAPLSGVETQKFYTGEVGHKNKELQSCPQRKWFYLVYNVGKFEHKAPT